MKAVRFFGTYLGAIIGVAVMMASTAPSNAAGFLIGLAIYGGVMLLRGYLWGREDAGK